MTVDRRRLRATGAALTWHRDAPLSEPADVAVHRLAQLRPPSTSRWCCPGRAATSSSPATPSTGSPEPSRGRRRPRVRSRWSRHQLAARRLPAAPTGPRVAPPRPGGAARGGALRGTWFAPFTGRTRGAASDHAAAGTGGDRREVRPAATVCAACCSPICGAWLPDNLLERGDRMSMAASLELRPPFLDHRAGRAGVPAPVPMKVRAWHPQVGGEAGRPRPAPRRSCVDRRRSASACPCGRGSAAGCVSWPGTGCSRRRVCRRRLRPRDGRPPGPATRAAASTRRSGSGRCSAWRCGTTPAWPARRDRGTVPVTLLGHGAASDSATAATPVRPVRVLHLLPDLAIGGGQTIVLNHLRHADRDRYDVRVAELRSGGELTADFVAVTGRQPLALHYDGTGRPAAVRRLVELMRANRVDLLHVHSDTDRKLGHAAALMTGIPVVGHLHAEWIHLGPMQPLHKTPLGSARSRVAGWARDRLEHRVVHHYIAESERVRDLFRPLVRQPITVMAQAIPVERFEGAAGHRSRVRTDLGLAADAPVLACVSRLVEGKGQASVIEATARLGPTGPTSSCCSSATARSARRSRHWPPSSGSPASPGSSAAATTCPTCWRRRTCSSSHPRTRVSASPCSKRWRRRCRPSPSASPRSRSSSCPAPPVRWWTAGRRAARARGRRAPARPRPRPPLRRGRSSDRRRAVRSRRRRRSFEAVYRSVLDDADLRRTRREATA